MFPMVIPTDMDFNMLNVLVYWTWREAPIRDVHDHDHRKKTHPNFTGYMTHILESYPRLGPCQLPFVWNSRVGNAHLLVSRRRGVGN
jgi:hypothetical protein